jgi:hypothetical protein
VRIGEMQRGQVGADGHLRLLPGRAQVVGVDDVAARAGGDQALAGHGAGLQQSLRGQRAGAAG